jgi:hypothetical protein
VQAGQSSHRLAARENALMSMPHLCKCAVCGEIIPSLAPRAEVPCGCTDKCYVKNLPYNAGVSLTGFYCRKAREAA